ncbi:MAG: chemoreceptor glutamine deamidase CheD, partial [Stenotrophomonas maltophilia]
MSLPIRNDEVMRYFDSRFKVTAAKLLPTQYLAVDDNTALTTTLGSCVAACLRDPVLKIGGMNHFLLPEGNVGDGAPARYGSYAMELKADDFTNTNDNFANVTFEIVDGNLVIDPIDVT